MHYINKKLSIFLILCSVLLCSFIQMDKVYGDSYNVGVISTGALGGGNGHGSHNYRHQIIAVGYRVSLVYTNNGERAKYNGNETKSVDYWNNSRDSSSPSLKIGYDALYLKDNNQYLKEDSRHYFSIKQLTKQELVNSNNFSWADNADKFKNEYLNKTNNLKHSETINDFYSEGTSNCYNIGTAYGLSTTNCVESSGNNFTVKVLNGIKNHLTSNSDKTQIDWVNFNKYLTNSGYGVATSDNSLAYKNVKDAADNGITVQFEPVEYILVYYDNGGDRLLYIGTISELYKMWADRGFFHEWWAGGYSEYTTLSSKIFALKSESDSSNTKAGLYLGKFEERNGKNVAIDLRTNSPYIENDPPDFYKYNNSLGVSLITLTDYLPVSTCNDEARVIVAEHCPNGNCDDGYINALKSNDKVKQKCIENGKITCSALLPNSIELFKGIDSSVTNACSDYICQTLADKIYDAFDGKNNAGVDDSKFEDWMEWLKTLYGNLNGLITSIWKYVLEEDKPSCKEIDIPNCPAIISGNCSNGELKFSADVGEKCIRMNIAYNNLNNISTSYISKSSYKKTIKTSDGENVKIYCSENVTFKLPTSPSTKAGRLLAWGTNLDNENSTGSDTDKKEFATMEIFQHCYTKGKSVKISKDTTISWDDDDVNTKIKIGYMSPIDHKYMVMGDLYKNVDSQKVNFTSGDEGGNVTSDGKVTSAISDYKVSVSYSFDYNNKFTWYSTKGLNSEYIDKNSYNSLSTEEKSLYTFIGYGLPTSLSTPDGTYEPDEDLLNAVIENIGSKDSDDENGRYNKYVTDVLGQSNGYEYNCPFSIHNPLFSYECYDKNGNLLSNAPDYCKVKKVKDIDVVFRTVELVSSELELSKAFPGRSGKGRTMGRNWAELSTTDIVKVLNSNIYNESEQYHIVLDVAKIKKIREANNNISSPYINMESDYYTCSGNKSKYSYCSSKFLTDLIENNILTGTCAQKKSGTDISDKTDARAKDGPCNQG